MMGVILINTSSGGFFFMDDLYLADVSSTRVNLTAGSSGLKAIMADIIGDYEAVTTDYTYRSGSSSYETHSVTTTPDWSWICCCLLFTVVVASCLRFLYSLLNRR